MPTLYRLLKNAPAYRQAGICPALRGIALTLALLDEEGLLLERKCHVLWDLVNAKFNQGII